MKMTKLFKINAIFAFGLAFISCANDIGEVKTKAKAAPKAYLQIETEIPLVRSAGPEEEYALENLKDIYLYVKKTEDEDGNTLSVSEKTLASSATFSAFSAKKYILSDGAGKYTIRMKGTIDSVYFYKKLENVSIRESETNKITLSLEPVKDSSHLDEAYEDFGGINCKIQFDKTNVSSILIKLARLTFDSESDDFIEETVEEKYITSLNNGNVTYKRVASYTSGSDSRIPAGTYRLTLDFLSYDDTLKDDILLNSYPYIVYVERGRNTYIDETFQLDPIYTITYNGISGASLADGSVKQTKYTRKDEVTLPVMKKAGNTFVGWYTTENFLEADGTTESGPVTTIAKGFVGNKTYYARFISSALYVSSSGSNTNEGSSSSSALASLDAAISKMQVVNGFELDYTIYLSGEFTGSNRIKDDIDEEGNVEKLPAKSITLVGYNGLDSTTGEPKDILNGTTDDGKVTALAIDTEVPVIIENLKITGGTGVLISAYEETSISSDVTLASGAYITENESCGVSLNAGSLTVLDGAVIENNTGSSGAGITVTDNSTADTRNLNIYGGKIQNNGSSDIVSAGNTNITISGTEKNGEASTIIGTFTIEAYDNTPRFNSWISGSVKIDSLIFAEEILHICDSPEITYCEIKEGAKVYLKDSPVIDELKIESAYGGTTILEGNLSSGASITITPSAYTPPYYDDSYEACVAKEQYIGIEGYEIAISDNYEYFHITPELDGEGNPTSAEWCIDIEGCLNLPRTVSFANLGEGNSLDTVSLLCKDFEPGDLPEPAAREGYIFNGWYYEDISGEIKPVDFREDYIDDYGDLRQDYEATCFYEDMTLYASWITASNNIYINTTDGIDYVSIGRSGENEIINNGTGAAGEPLKTFKEALNVIKKIKNDQNDYTLTIRHSSSEYNIYIDDKIPAKSLIIQGSEEGTTEDPDGFSKSDGVSSDDYSYQIRVSTQIPVTFQNLTITNELWGYTTEGSVMNITGGANVTLGNNVIVKGHDFIYGGGKAPLGAIAVERDSTLTMLDGSLIDTFKIRNGAVYVKEGGKFIMEGGTITHINSEYSGGAVYVEGGSSEISGANFEMKGGSITGNETASINNSNFTTNLHGAGVCVVSGSFEMSGGEITNNTAHVSEVSWSTAAGGGVFVYADASFTMTGGTISGNKAVKTYVNSSNETVEGPNASAYGGGVCLQASEDKLASFTMTGGTISGNTADTSGNGIAVLENLNDGVTGTITLGKDALIENNDICLPSNVTITISYQFSGDDNHPIKATITPQNYQTGLTLLEGTEELLESDYDYFAVTPQVTGQAPDTITTKWYIDKSGRLYKPSVGDLLLTNGTFIYYNESGTFTNDEVETAVGVVYGLDEEGMPKGIIGLKNSLSYKDDNNYPILTIWAPQGTTGYNTKFEDIICTPSVDGETLTFEGDTDGSDNWEYICGKDPDGSDAPATNYPAFNYARNYAKTAGLTGSDYGSGWYMPSAAEMYDIYKNLTTINSAITQLNAGSAQESNPNPYDTLSGLYFWTSSQANNGDAWYINITATSNPFTSSSKDFQSPSVCCIHAIK